MREEGFTRRLIESSKKGYRMENRSERARAETDESKKATAGESPPAGHMVAR